jgi:hypothetical protein
MAVKPRAEVVRGEKRFLRDRHVHLGVPLHRPNDPPVRLSPGDVDHLGLEEQLEQQGHDRDHDRTPDELGQRELPSEQHGQQDPELDDQVRRGELEGHRRREVRAVAEDGSGERDGGVGA